MDRRDNRVKEEDQWQRLIREIREAGYSIRINRHEKAIISPAPPTDVMVSLRRWRPQIVRELKREACYAHWSETVQEIGRLWDASSERPWIDDSEHIDQIHRAMEAGDFVTVYRLADEWKTAWNLTFGNTEKKEK
jgi:hypothetical protein